MVEGRPVITDSDILNQIIIIIKAQGVWER
jgi:hypothetical protein